MSILTSTQLNKKAKNNFEFIQPTPKAKWGRLWGLCFKLLRNLKRGKQKRLQGYVWAEV